MKGSAISARYKQACTTPRTEGVPSGRGYRSSAVDAVYTQQLFG